jgi:hypothetical protein
MCPILPAAVAMTRSSSPLTTRAAASGSVETFTLGVRFYRERRLDIYALGDRGRALLYGGVAGIVLALAGTRRWLDTPGGTAA